MSDVKLEKVEKTYGDHVALHGIDLHVQPGEFVTLLGPSGCGKTTCLRLMAGFIMPTRGRITMGGRDVTDLPPHRRNTGMVFQSYALFPHRTVGENVAFGLEVRRLARAERDARVADALRLVRLDHLADKYPGQLSGGQKQRVALARAVVIKPDVLLLDEPLAALDLKLREELQVEIKRVQSAINITTVFVTHDQGEALSMSDRIAVMRDGVVVQIGAPDELYERPNSRYVANFVGRTNLIEVAVRGPSGGAGYRVESRAEPGLTFEVAGPQTSAFEAGEPCLLATRPEHVHLGSGAPNALQGKVRTVTYLGSVSRIEIDGPGGEVLSALAHPGDALPPIGEVVPISWRPDRSFLLKDA
jgi:putative spermidine/putrescine transport system ATP-binding protein